MVVRWGVFTGLLAAVAVVLGSVLGPSAWAAPRRTWVDLGPGDALGINDRQQIVGVIRTPQGYRAVLWQDRKPVYLKGLKGGLTHCNAQAINEQGQIAGSCGNSDGSVTHAVTWYRSAIKDLGTLGGPFSTATGINSHGDVVGESKRTAAAPPHAFLWRAGKMTDLGTLGPSYPQSIARGINDNRRVVGWSTQSSGLEHAFRWADGHMKALPSPKDVQTEATAINDRGQISGGALTPVGLRPALWTGGVFRFLPTLGGDGAALAINQNCVDAGWVQMNAAGSADAAIWVRMRLVDLGKAQHHSTIANGLNDKGDVVGRAETSSGTRAVAFLLPKQ